LLVSWTQKVERITKSLNMGFRSMGKYLTHWTLDIYHSNPKKINCKFRIFTSKTNKTQIWANPNFWDDNKSLLKWPYWTRKVICSHESFSQYYGYTNLKAFITSWARNYFSSSSLTLVVSSKHYLCTLLISGFKIRWTNSSR
jgi:hypothetical protein